MDNKRKEMIEIVTQAFYGNRVVTEVNKNNVDSFIIGSMDNNIPLYKNIDRTIINLPNEDNIVIIYNKHEEERWLKNKEEALKEKNRILKPLAIIPELNIELYSRCIACRIDENGELASIENGDYEKIIKYFAE